MPWRSNTGTANKRQPKKWGLFEAPTIRRSPLVAPAAKLVRLVYYSIERPHDHSRDNAKRHAGDQESTVACEVHHRRNNSGSRAMFAAIRLASSRLSRFKVLCRVGSSSK